MYKCRIFILAALFVVVAPGALSALKVPDRPGGYVTDRAGFLSGSARLRLEKKLTEFEKVTSNQIVVATFPSLEGDSLEDFSIRLAQAWKPGQKNRNNGVIFLIFKNDRKMRIEVGYGLEGALTDALAGQIIREVVAPEFKVGNFEQGIFSGTEAIMQAVRGEYKGIHRRTSPRRVGFVLFWFFVFLGLNWGLDRLRRGGMNGIYYGNRRGFGGYWGVGGFGGGSGGGGFSGGGGGFGGGGASGGW